MDTESYKKSFDSLKQYKDENQYLYELVSLISKILYERNTFVKNSENDSLRAEFYEFLKEKLKEIYEFYKVRSKEDSNISDDIEFIGNGHTSLAFRVGDSVLKIGKGNNISTVDQGHDFPCLIPIFFSKYFKIAEKEYYTLQLSPLVDTNNIDEEEVYGAYKSLRDLGYIWNDPKPENVGRIIKDINFEDHFYNTGDIVIIDLEDLAYVGEITTDEVLEEISMMSYNRKTYIYETRYMAEKGKSMR